MSIVTHFFLSVIWRVVALYLRVNVLTALLYVPLPIHIYSVTSALSSRTSWMKTVTVASTVVVAIASAGATTSPSGVTGHTHITTRAAASSARSSCPVTGGLRACWEGSEAWCMHLHTTTADPRYRGALVTTSSFLCYGALLCFLSAFWIIVKTIRLANLLQSFLLKKK